MQFKKIQTIITFVAIAMRVSSSPIFNTESSLSNGIIDEFIDDVSGLFGKAMKKEEEYDGDLCLTPECVMTSARILKSIDSDVDPCDDFYQFSCGNWMKNAVIAEDKSMNSLILDLYDENNKILRGIIEGDYKINNNTSVEQQNLDKKVFGQIKDIYNTCMDTKNITTKGKEPLTKLLNQLEIYKNKDSYKDVNGFTNLIAKLFNNVSSIFVGVDVFGNINDPTNNVLYVTDDTFGLPSKEYYQDEKVVTAYKELIKNMLSNILKDEKQENDENFLSKLFSGSNKRDFDKLSDSIIELEKKLADITIPPEMMYDFTIYNEVNVKVLNEKYPYINWNLYFDTILSNFNMKGAVNDTSLIILQGPSYFEGLNNILKETDVETIAAYAEWTVISTYGKYISDEFNEPLKKFKSAVYGVTTEPERSEYCIELVDSAMGMGLGKFFVNEAFSSESKEAAKETIENIRESMKERISKNSWLDKQTRDYALEKLNAIVGNVGYPEYIMDPKKLDEEYTGLSIVNNDFFTNVVNASKYIIAKKIKEVYKPVRKDKWSMTPSTVDAYYSPLDSNINFPAGILRSPLFNSAQPHYLNYGAIGSIVGHELTHAFDDTGRLFDSNGKYSNWWTNSTTEEFEKLSQCFVDQYGNYTVEDTAGKKHNVNGKLTLGENIADNGGLDRAFEAYKLSLSKNKSKVNNKSLPGLSKYTNEQLFYIAFGQNWCTKQRPESEVEKVRTDPHSPARYRVIGSIRNSEYFASVFKCKTNSPMNPEKKCSIW